MPVQLSSVTTAASGHGSLPFATKATTPCEASRHTPPSSVDQPSAGSLHGLEILLGEKKKSQPQARVSYEIDTASLILTSKDLIPLEEVHEVPLVQALIKQPRRFVKPLRYDTGTPAGFPNALPLDVGSPPARRPD